MPPAASICIASDVPERGRPETTVITLLNSASYEIATNLGPAQT